MPTAPPQSRHAAAAQRAAPTAVARARLGERLRELGVKDERVLTVMTQVPRHEFVEPAFQGQAYHPDLTAPIGHAQTLSQARIVALMTEALIAGLPKLDKVLEIGTGSGYQTAVLAALCGTVFTVERIKALSESARIRLGAMHLRNVHFGYADGTEGWASFAPYDGIVATAGAARVAPALITQLKVGGRLVIPVALGSTPQAGSNDHQSPHTLQVHTRTASGSTVQNLMGVSFVPLLSGRV